ncbi:MAG: ABC transporter transmembrane domain-containing protein, partial [Chloroflexota bacterium]
FGASINSAPLFLDGIGGVIAARSGSGPTLDEAFGTVQAEIDAGRSVSIFTNTLAAPEPDVDRAAWDSTATAFVAYLIEAFRPPALRQFLASYDAERRDQAAAAAFQRPLGALEEAWLGAVARRRGQSGALGTLFGYLKPLLKPYWKQEIEVLVLMLLGITYSLTIPLSGKYLVDTVIPSRHIGDLVRFILVLLAIYAFNTVVGVRRAYVNNWINQRVLVELQERMFGHLLRLSHNFYGTAKVGDIITRMSGDLQIIQQAMGQVAGVGIYQALVAIAAATTIIILNPLLGLLILLVLPLFLLSYLLLAKRLSTTSRERQKLTGEVAAATEEHLSAHAVVKAFGMEQRSKA